MDTWKDLAKENRTVTYELLDRKRYRSAVSRSYFAVYARLSEILSKQMVFSLGWQGPRHSALRDLILNNLYAIEPTDRKELCGQVIHLYTLRLYADYVPTIAIERDEARIAFGIMDKILRKLEVSYENTD